MARYDRIARLPCRHRDDCYPGWLTLRDLDGREREPELGRRARLRFLALRPLRRLLARGLDGFSAASLQLQIDGVREEVERLHARDPERSRLAEYLEEVGGRSALGVVTATLDVGAAAESAGHPYAAEEFYRTGLELAREHELASHEVRALRRLARVHRARDEWETAIALGREAAERAATVGENVQWAMAMDEIARSEKARGDEEAGRALLEQIDQRGCEMSDDHVRAVAAAALCSLDAAAGALDDALRNGARAVALFPMTSPHRNGALLDMGSALRRLGFWEAAEVCYNAVETRSTWVEHRAEAATERAVIAAERGDVEGFRLRRRRILERIDAGDLRMRALLHLGLGRGCLVAGEVDDARDHLRDAIASARDADLETLLAGADELLGILERGDRLVVQRPRLPSPESRAIAENVLNSVRAEVTAGA